MSINNQIECRFKLGPVIRPLGEIHEFSFKLQKGNWSRSNYCETSINFAENRQSYIQMECLLKEVFTSKLTVLQPAFVQKYFIE
jgi:hypothetical protein